MVQGYGTVLLADRVAELLQQRDEFLKAAVNIPNEVEGAVLAFLVVPKRLPLDRSRVGLLLAREFEDVPNAFSLQTR